MAARGRTPPEPEGPWRLRVRRETARSDLDARIALGRGIADRTLSNTGQLEDAKQAYYTWWEYNRTLLDSLFTDSRARKEYEAHGAFFVAGGERSFSDRVEEFRDDVKRDLRRLVSITERIPLAEEPAVQPAARNLASSSTSSASASKRVFVVHGRSGELKEAVARFLEKLDLDAVILHEQPNAGRTIIEKFETYSDVAFAVVLLTPDDVGALATEAERLRPRARQNVTFELGYFFGKLGRERVAAVYVGDLERPTDTDGVLYIDGSSDTWRLLLARELKAAGLSLDMNRLG